jgi:hypothetical protein
VLGAGGLDAYTVQRLVEPLALSKSFARIRGYSFGPQVILTKQWSHASELFELGRRFFVADTLFGSSSFHPPEDRSERPRRGHLQRRFVEYPARSGCSGRRMRSRGRSSPRERET